MRLCLAISVNFLVVQMISTRSFHCSTIDLQCRYPDLLTQVSVPYAPVSAICTSTLDSASHVRHGELLLVADHSILSRATCKVLVTYGGDSSHLAKSRL